MAQLTGKKKKKKRKKGKREHMVEPGAGEVGGERQLIKPHRDQAFTIEPLLQLQGAMSARQSPRRCI
jgi:hypothetical protein